MYQLGLIVEGPLPSIGSLLVCCSERPPACVAKSGRLISESPLARGVGYHAHASMGGITALQKSLLTAVSKSDGQQREGRSNLLRVSIFGLGYVGTVCAGCLAQDGHHVIGVDPVRTK